MLKTSSPGSRTPARGHRAGTIAVCLTAAIAAGAESVATESLRPVHSPQGTLQGTPQGTSRPARDGLRYGLPFSQEKGFAGLDDYLAHLRELGASDVPYFLEVEPDVFMPVAGRQPGTVRFTREELRRRFGFDR